MRSHSSTGASTIGPSSITPALLTTVSSRPSSATVRSTASIACCWSVTSVSSTRARPPAAPIVGGQVVEAVLAPGRQGHGRALGGQRPGGGLADAAAGPGHEGHGSVESCGHATGVDLRARSNARISARTTTSSPAATRTSAPRSWAATCSARSAATWGDDDWRGWWGPEPPYHHPVFVLTHHPHDADRDGGRHHVPLRHRWHRVGAGRRRSRPPAGADVRVGGGPATIQQYLRAGLVDWMHVAGRPDAARRRRAPLRRRSRIDWLRGRRARAIGVGHPRRAGPPGRMSPARPVPGQRRVNVIGIYFTPLTKSDRRRRGSPAGVERRRGGRRAGA